MAELKDRVQSDLTTAMKARDDVRTRTLRSVLTAISNEEVSGQEARELGDEDVVKLIAREAKKRREAAEAFEERGRTEQAAAERAEGEVLADYLPAQLGDDELRGIVAAAIAETGAQDVKAMGQVMRAATPRAAGRAEGSRIAAEVKRQLLASSSQSQNQG
ncbi:GatB/YqeY domain-containing protein [Streptomonospora sediminis]